MKITQKQLIESLKQMKEIKPRQKWVTLLRSQVLAEKKVEIEIPVRKAKYVGFMETFSSVFSPRKLVYSFAALLFLIVTAFGFSKYAMPGDLLFPAKKIVEQSTADLTGQTQLNQDVVALNNRVNDLKQVASQGKVNNIPSAISEVTQVAKDLKNNPTKDPQTIKNIATSLKVLADVPGTDLTETQDVKDLYQTVVQNQIADLQKTTLTDSQKSILNKAEDLYSQGKYSEALELLMTNN